MILQKKIKGNIYEELQNECSKPKTRSYRFSPCKSHKYSIKETAMLKPHNGKESSQGWNSKAEFSTEYWKKEVDLVHI